MIDTYAIILTALFGLFISLISFTIKSASKKIHSVSFTLNRFILIGVIILIYVMYDNSKSPTTSLIITDIYKVKYEIIFASVITIIAAILEAYLIDKYEVTFIAPISIVWGLLFIALIGKFVYNEKFSMRRCVGYLLISTGLIVVSTS